MQWGKDSLFTKLNIQMWKSEIESLSHTTHKNQLKIN